MFTQEEKSAFFTLFEKKKFNYFDGTTYYFKNSKVKSYGGFIKMLNMPSCLKETSGLDKVYIKYLEKSFDKIEFEEIVQEYSEGRMEEVKLPSLEGVGSSNNQNISEYLGNLVPVLDFRANAKNKVILLSPLNGMRPVNTIDTEMYLKSIGMQLEDLIKDDTVARGMSIFNPYQLEAVYKDKLKGDTKFEMTYINTYVPAPWRYVKVEPALTGFIKDLIDHLFPIEEEKEAVLDWLHYSLVRRCETVLCLVGSRGTGKGLLLGDIQSQLIGEDYRENVNQEILRDKFNAAFKGKRYIFFDEVDISGTTERSKFKAFANNTIVVEEKGSDSETIDNFTSMGLTSNEKSHIVVLPQDRRFSIPRVTERPFVGTTKYTYEDVDTFTKRIKEPGNKELAEFGQFLLDRKPKTKSQTPIKGQYYFELCKLAMPEWQIFLLDYLMYHGEKNTPITASELKKQFQSQYGKDSKFPNKQGTFESFFGDYLHDGVYPLGKIINDYDQDKQRKTFSIVPNDSFIERYGGKKPPEPKKEESSKLFGGFSVKPPEVKEKINPENLL